MQIVAGNFSGERPVLAAAARIREWRDNGRRSNKLGASGIASAGWLDEAVDMLDFMDHVQNAFYEASHWNVDNSYGNLNATARGKSCQVRRRLHADGLVQLCSISRHPEDCACTSPHLLRPTLQHRILLGAWASLTAPYRTCTLRCRCSGRSRAPSWTFTMSSEATDILQI